jgi:hypothetical protein
MFDAAGCGLVLSVDTGAQWKPITGAAVLLD